MKKVLLLLGVIISFVFAELPSYFHDQRLYSGLYVEWWNYGGINTVESVVPVYYSIGLDRMVKGLSFDVVTSPMSAIIGGNGMNVNGVFSVSGTKMRGSYNLLDFVLFTAGMQIPTTSNTLSASARNAEGAISTHQMDFQVSRIGTGLDIDLTASASYALSDAFTAGLGVGYLAHGKFTPVDGQKYNPGNEFTLVLGADYTTLLSGVDTKIMGNFFWTHYGKDKLGTTDVFRAGDRFNIALNSVFRFNSGMSDQASLNIDIMGKQTTYGPLTVSTAVSNSFKLANQLTMQGTEQLKPFYIARINLFTPNGLQKGKALIVGAGGGCSFLKSRNMTFRAQGVLQGGAMDRNALFGVEMSGGVDYGF